MTTCSDNFYFFQPSGWVCSFGEGLLTGVMNGIGQSTYQAKSSFFEEFRKELVYTSLVLGGVGTAILVGQIGLRLIGAYFDAYLHHIVGKPKLAIEYKFDNWSTSLSNFVTAPYRVAKRILFGRAPEPAKPIFKEEIQKQIDRIKKNTQNVCKNEGIFTNLLLYGPPGTGKTMVSKEIAKSANMNYVMMSGGDLAQFIKRGEHVSEFNHLFERIKSSSKPTILFVDEAEGLTKRRDRLDMERVELLNAFLNETGSPSTKFMLILATNRPGDLDPAVISRMDNQILISPPEPEERLNILKLYVQEFFKPNDLKLVLTDEYLAQLNMRFDGFTGRDIYKFCNILASAKAATSNNQLTHEIVEESIEQTLRNRQQLQEQIALGA